ncbi:hypothetical protein [Nostoc sp.]|uniref:hypothetical protein n=1 Tax=Nostoc sp. TaxID=1180 RepID=UPI002FF4CA40
MKLITRVCLALLLAITITFSNLHSNAHAAPLPISIDVNQTVDQILNNISFKTKFNILVINKTGGTLRRVGAYNDSGNWPVGDIESNTALPVEFEGNSITNSFSIASNYKINNGKYSQFVATWPTIGSRKIGLAAINQEGNGPAKSAWENTNDKNDKALNNSPYQARAFITGKGSSVVWVYEVTQA